MSSTTSLDAGALAALRLIGPDPQNWVPARDGIDHNVAIVGGGQTGCAFAFALRRAGVGGVTVLDAAEGEAQAGVWLTRARMQKLRTPKNLAGPELSVPQLGFQAWFEARHGADAYAAIDRIPRTVWADYLAWYRHFLDIPVRYGTRLERIEPAGDHLRLHLRVDGAARIETARKVILGNGVAAGGGAFLPPALRGLPASLRAHTADAIDPATLRGKTVAVVGGAASAFDAAGVALEAGAREVHLFARRPALASVPISRLRGYPGAYDNYPLLPDAVRWLQAVRYRRAGSTATVDAIERAVAFPNFHLHLAAPWHAAAVEDDRIRAETGAGVFQADFVIAATGFAVDLSLRPELADFAGDILLWRDRFTPPDDQRDDDLGAHPYLGTGHQFVEKVPGAAPFLRHIHVFNPAGFVSFGFPVGDVPSVKRGIPAVTAQISRDFFLDDLYQHEWRITGTIAADFGPELYGAAVRTR